MVESTFVAVGGWDGHMTKVHKKRTLGRESYVIEEANNAQIRTV